MTKQYKHSKSYMFIRSWKIKLNYVRFVICFWCAVMQSLPHTAHDVPLIARVIEFQSSSNFPLRKLDNINSIETDMLLIALWRTSYYTPPLFSVLFINFFIRYKHFLNNSLVNFSATRVSSN